MHGYVDEVLGDSSINTCYAVNSAQAFAERPLGFRTRLRSPAHRSLRLYGVMRVVLSSALDGEMLLGKSLRAHVEELSVPDGAWVVLDPLCPLVPAVFVAELVERVAMTGRPHVGVRPVTDTVKLLADGVVGATLDRDALRSLAAPLVLASEPSTAGTMVELVASLEDVVLVEAPPLARRVNDRSEILLLEALADSDEARSPTAGELSPRPGRPRGT